MVGQFISAKATTPDALEDLSSWWDSMILKTMR
jgi:hypothetical protein